MGHRRFYNNTRDRSLFGTGSRSRRDLWTTELIGRFKPAYQWGCLYFDGTAHATYKDAELIGATEDWTIEFWASIYDYTNYQRIFCQSETYTPLTIYYYQGFALNFGALHDIRFASVGLSTNDWLHVAFRKNGSIYEAFKNGVKAEQMGLTPTTGTSTTNNFGSRSNTSSFADVDLWQFRIWDYPLSDMEIGELMYTQVNSDNQNLKAYWPLSDGSGTTAADVTGNGWDLTLVGAYWWPW